MLNNIFKKNLTHLFAGFKKVKFGVNLFIGKTLTIFENALSTYDWFR